MNRNKIIFFLSLAVALLTPLKGYPQYSGHEREQTGEQRQCPGGNPRVASTSQQARTPPSQGDSTSHRHSETPASEGASAQ